MSLAAVPDDGEVYIAGSGMSYAGRQLRAASGVPVVWVSDSPITSAGIIWTAVAERSARSGLQPVLLSGLHGGTARPWDTGEQVGDPEDTTAIDGIAPPRYWKAGGGLLAKTTSRRMRTCGRCSRRLADGFPVLRPPWRRTWTRS